MVTVVGYHATLPIFNISYNSSRKNIFFVSIGMFRSMYAHNEIQKVYTLYLNSFVHSTITTAAVLIAKE